MAGAAIPGFPGQTGGSSSGGSTTVGGTQVISPLAIPQLNDLFNTAKTAVPTEMRSLDQMIQEGMNSPLLQLVLGPMMERLKAPQAAARTNLTETTRAAGGLRGSTYGQDMNTLQNNQAQQGNDLMAQVLQQILGPLITGQMQEQKNSFLPAEAYTNLLGAAKPSLGKTATTTTGWENIASSLGLGTPMEGDAAGGSNIANLLRSLQAGKTATPSATGAPTAPATPGAPPPQYVDPYSGGYGAIDSPFTSPEGQPGGAAYQHDYGTWQDVTDPQAMEGWW